MKKKGRQFEGDTTLDLNVLRDRVREVHPKPEPPEGVTAEYNNLQYEGMVDQLARELRKFNTLHLRAYTAGKRTFFWGRNKRGRKIPHTVQTRLL